MTTKEQQELEYELKLQAQIALDKGKKLLKNPIVQFAIGFIGMDLYLRKR